MSPDRGLDTELASPKYACFELERRWLVDTALRPNIEGTIPTLIEDLYIDGTRMRLRRMASGEHVVWKLTKKYEAERPEARRIVTAYLTEAEHVLFAALPAFAMRKRRYRLTVDGRVWSLDLFEGALAGLELLETEAESEAELAALVPPPWAAKEVTHDARYQCGSLAQINVIPE